MIYMFIILSPLDARSRECCCCMLEELTVLDCSLCGENGGSRDARDSFELPRAAEMVSENFCS